MRTRRERPVISLDVFVWELKQANLGMLDTKLLRRLSINNMSILQWLSLDIVPGAPR